MDAIPQNETIPDWALEPPSADEVLSKNEVDTATEISKFQSFLHSNLTPITTGSRKTLSAADSRSDALKDSDDKLNNVDENANEAPAWASTSLVTPKAQVDSVSKDGSGGSGGSKGKGPGRLFHRRAQSLMTPTVISQSLITPNVVSPTNSIISETEAQPVPIKEELNAMAAKGENSEENLTMFRSFIQHRRTQSSRSVMATDDPSELYRLVHNRKWRKAIRRCETHPSEGQYQNEFGRTALHRACFFYDTPVTLIGALLDAFPDSATLQNNDGETPLHNACLRSSATVVIRLLHTSIPAIVIPNNEGQTPLELICTGYKSDITRAFNTSVSSPATQGNMSHSEQLLSRSTELQKFWAKATPLLKAHAHASVDDPLPGNKRWLPVHACIATPKCPMDLIKLAVKLHPEQLREFDDVNNTPLHICAMETPSARKYAIMDLVLNNTDHNDNTTNNICTKRNQSGHLPLHLAATTPPAAHEADTLEWEQEEDINLLIKSLPSSARMKNPNGKLPLHLACATGRRWNDGVKQLTTAYKAAISIKDEDTGLFPFMIAAAVQNDMASLNCVYNLFRECPDVYQFCPQLEELAAVLEQPPKLQQQNTDPDDISEAGSSKKKKKTLAVKKLVKTAKSKVSKSTTDKQKTASESSSLEMDQPQALDREQSKPSQQNLLLSIESDDISETKKKKSVKNLVKTAKSKVTKNTAEKQKAATEPSSFENEQIQAFDKEHSKPSQQNMLISIESDDIGEASSSMKKKKSLVVKNLVKTAKSKVSKSTTDKAEKHKTATEPFKQPPLTSTDATKSVKTDQPQALDKPQQKNTLPTASKNASPPLTTADISCLQNDKKSNPPEQHKTGVVHSEKATAKPVTFDVVRKNQPEQQQKPFTSTTATDKKVSNTSTTNVSTKPKETTINATTPPEKESKMESSTNKTTPTSTDTTKTTSSTAFTSTSTTPSKKKGAKGMTHKIKKSAKGMKKKGKKKNKIKDPNMVTQDCECVIM